MLYAKLLPSGLKPSSAGWSRNLTLSFQRLKSLERPGKLVFKSFLFPSWKEHIEFFASRCGYNPESWVCYESDCLLQIFEANYIWGSSLCESLPPGLIASQAHSGLCI